MPSPEFSLPSGQTDEHAAYLRWVLGLLPPDICGFCETHSASVELLVNLPTARVESMNDVADEVSNFFHAARELPELFGMALTEPKLPMYDRSVCRARDFFKLAVWGRFAAVNRPVKDGWRGVYPLPFMPEPSRFETKWCPRVPHLREVFGRLKMLAFDARPATEILKIYARPNILRLIAPRCLADIGEGIVDMAFDTPGEVLLILPSAVAEAAGWIGKPEDGWFLDKNLELGLFAVGNYDRAGLSPSLLSGGWE